jgi:hypothetical protein
MTTAVHPHIEQEQSLAERNGHLGRPPGPLEAVLAHPFLTLLPIVLLVGAAIAYGMTREPVYTAEARLGVGSLSPTAAAMTPSTDGNEQLAATYARGITSAPVVEQVSARSGLSEGVVRARLDASPVAESPVFWITGSGPSESQAVSLTREATAAMRAWVSSVSGGDNSAGLLRDFERAQLRVSAAQRALEEAELVGGAAEQRAKADYQTAQLQANALKSDYLEEFGHRGGEPVRVVTEADLAVSDESRKLKLFVVAGALAGITLGVVLATLVAALQRRRRAFAPTP